MGNIVRAVKAYLDTKHQMNSLACSQVSIEAWFETQYGQYLLNQESQGLQHVMPDLGAHRMMYLGVTPKRLLQGEFNHLHSFSVGVSSDSVGDAAVIADFDALPLPSETIDTVLLHHALEFSLYPHEVLKEASRVLKPCGHMALVVLNPVSMFGLIKWPARFVSMQAIWRHHSLRYGRILDWLRLLNIQPVKAVSGGFFMPIRYSSKGDISEGASEKGKGGLMDRLGQRYSLPFGAYYILIARKYVARPTFSGPRKWKSIRIPDASAVKKNGVIKAQLMEDSLSEKMLIKNKVLGEE
jgi:SAM-dependent methyltransferase